MCVCVCVCTSHVTFFSNIPLQVHTLQKEEKKLLKLFQLMFLSVGIIQFKIYHCSGNSFSDMRIRHKIYKSRNYGLFSAYV